MVNRRAAFVLLGPLLTGIVWATCARDPPPKAPSPAPAPIEMTPTEVLSPTPADGEWGGATPGALYGVSQP